MSPALTMVACTVGTPPAPVEWALSTTGSVPLLIRKLMRWAWVGINGAYGGFAASAIYSTFCGRKRSGSLSRHYDKSSALTVVSIPPLCIEERD